MPKHKVFVYGTLRDGQPATHRLLRYMMRGVAGKKFSFPFIEAVEEDSYEVIGNVLEVSDARLKVLDTYEGIANGLYIRKREWVLPIGRSDGAEHAWVYVGGPALVYPIVNSGDWLNR